jgi:Putative rhamnosyl transferase
MSRRQPFVHVVLTRFNALIGYAKDPDRRIDEAWLEERFRLFDKFCYPSLAAQSVPFNWLVFCDARTPREFLERIEGYSLFTPILTTERLADSDIANAVAERLPADASHVITTRIDNDDAIAGSYLARVQGAFRRQELEFVNFPIGYDWHAGRFYYRIALSNTFISLIERVPTDRSQLRTVHCGEHTQLRRIAPVRQVLSPPIWQVTVHGGNVVNEVLGVRRLWPQPPREFLWQDAQLHADDAFPATIADLVGSMLRLFILPVRRIRRLAKRFVTQRGL